MNNLKSLYNKLLELKDKGNKEFSLDNSSKRASTFYILAIQLYEKYYKELSLKEDSIENENEISKLVAIILSNLSLVYLNKNEVDKALEYSSKAISMDAGASNSKCYYRNSVSNRSLCRYQEALESIEKAIQIEKSGVGSGSALITQYEKEKKATESKIEKSIKEEEDFKKRMKIDHQKYFSQFPSCSIVYKPGYGRVTQANKDLEQGEILLRVAPFASVLEYESLFKYCSFCLQKIQDKSERAQCKCSNCNMELICKRCRALDGNPAIAYHNELCDILAYLNHNHSDSIQDSRDFRLMARIFQNISKARKLDKDHRNPTVYANKQSDDGRPYIADNQDDFINLSRDTQVHDKEQLAKFKRATMSLLNLITMVRGYEFFSMLSQSEMFSLFSTVLSNAHSISHPIKQKQIGSGVFPSACYFNHSCNPNAYWYLDNQGMMVITTNKAVSKGEELFVSYVPQTETIENRRETLLNSYSFFCQCELCEFQNNLTGLLCDECKEPLYENSIQYHEPTDPNDTGITFTCSNGHDKVICIKSKEEFQKEIEDELLDCNTSTKDPRTYSQVNLAISKIQSIEEFEHYKSILPLDQFLDLEDKLPVFVRNLNNLKRSQLYQELIDSLLLVKKELDQVLKHPLYFPFQHYYSNLFNSLKSENPTSNADKLSQLKQLIISNFDKNLYNNHKQQIDKYLTI